MTTVAMNKVLHAVSTTWARSLNVCGWALAGCIVSAASLAAPSGTIDLSSMPSGAVNLYGTRIDFALPNNPPAGAAGVGDVSIGAHRLLRFLRDPRVSR